MIASQAALLKLLKQSTQFIIPIYQRTYSWKEPHCRQLWNDILRAGSSDEVTCHFIGSVVYIQQGLSQTTNQSPLLVIDGQQRLTTVTLLLEALARALGDQEPVDGFSAPKIREWYLINHLLNDDRFFKLLLTQTDNASLKAIIRNREAPVAPSFNITQNFELFCQLVEEQKGDLVPICKGLEKLMVVDVALDSDRDNPQLIFESMNSTGKALSQADLIRNFILMGLEPTRQMQLYDNYWRPMEMDFGQEAYDSKFDSFMRHYLTFRTSNIPRESEVYEAFKSYFYNKIVREAGIEALVKDLRSFAGYYCAIGLNKERNPELKRAFHDLKELKVDVAYPFLLELYDDYTNEKLNVADFSAALRLMESYVFRRSICSIPTNSLNKTFANFGKELKKDRYLESIKAHFLMLPSYRRFPSDEEFQRDLQTRDLYNFRSCSYWLRRLENHGRKERVAVDEYTIEHIMPQNQDLSTAWQSDLGIDWQRIHKTWLHTLGNLTLTGYNSEYSDHPFREKRDRAGGFKESPLKLNAELGAVETWNEDAIKHRAKALSKTAIKVWTAPILDDAVFANYKQVKEKKNTEYTIENHPKLLTAPVQSLFEAFRKEVLAIDPCVSEEFLKLYVAYKAETNFVDVVPQAARLRLSINLPFSDINDPKGLCKDVSDLGRWGNGDVEVGLSSLDELPYIMSLVQQAYETQMGEGGQP